MTKKGLILSILAAFMAATYVTFFTDWFEAKSIQIIASLRGKRPSTVERWDTTQVKLVPFKLDSKYKLTSLKVVMAEDWATNQYPVPLWEMVAEDGSEPVDTIIYGQKVKGMKPKLSDQFPEPLEADIHYLLLLEAGRIKGQTNFFTTSL